MSHHERGIGSTLPLPVARRKGKNNQQVEKDAFSASTPRLALTPRHHPAFGGSPATGADERVTALATRIWVPFALFKCRKTIDGKSHGLANARSEEVSRERQFPDSLLTKRQGRHRLHLRSGRSETARGFRSTCDRIAPIRCISCMDKLGSFGQTRAISGAQNTATLQNAFFPLFSLTDLWLVTKRPP